MFYFFFLKKKKNQCIPTIINSDLKFFWTKTNNDLWIRKIFLDINVDSCVLIQYKKKKNIKKSLFKTFNDYLLTYFKKGKEEKKNKITKEKKEQEIYLFIFKI